jgi:hypothetical protein
MLCSLFCLWLTISDVKPVADETWVVVSPGRTQSVPAARTVTLSWFGKSYPPEEIKATADGGWMARFHVRVQPPVQVNIDEHDRGQHVTPSPQPEHGPCFLVTRAGQTLWHTGTQLSGGQEPYLFVLALFAANRELLQNDPNGLRVGDELTCPKDQDFAPFITMTVPERKKLYQRLLGYGERINRH